MVDNPAPTPRAAKVLVDFCPKFLSSATGLFVGLFTIQLQLSQFCPNWGEMRHKVATVMLLNALYAVTHTAYPETPLSGPSCRAN